MPPITDHEKIKSELAKDLKNRHKGIVVLYDDPTGIQTVHGINVYMSLVA